MKAADAGFAKCACKITFENKHININFAMKEGRHAPLRRGP